MSTEVANTSLPNGSEVKKIKSIVLTSTGGGNDYSNLQVKEEDYPKIEANDQVIVKIKAAGLNFAELMQRQGLYKPSTKTPYTPGYEASGVVETVGSDVTDLKPNDRVIVFSGSGIWKEVVRVPRANAIKIPDTMTYEEAAGLIVNYVTAYHILFRMGNLQPNDVVLVHMAAGGVGFALTQLCKTVEGVVVIGTASAGKHDAIKANGVDHCIDYTKGSYVTEVKKLYADGVDLVCDPLNGENSIKGYDLLRPLGRIVHYGAASMTTESRSLINAFKTWWKCLSINSLEIISENKSVSGYHLGCLFTSPSALKKTFKDIDVLLDLYKQGKIKVKIDSEYPYKKIGEAMKRMHNRQNVGKIILKPDCEWKEPANTEEVKVESTEATSLPPTTVEVKKESVSETPVAKTPEQKLPVVENVTTSVDEASSVVGKPTIEAEVKEAVSA